MRSYSVFAQYYDELTSNVEYPKRAEYLLELMELDAASGYKNASECVDYARRIKDDDEKTLMIYASQLNDQAMAEFRGLIKEGVTELEVAAGMNAIYKRLGTQGPSFGPIVSFGANAAEGHHKPDNTVLKPGDAVLFDVGCRINDYCSDMTRTFFWKKADPEYVRIYNIVKEANEKAEALVREGVSLCDIDAAARDHIASFGYGEYFTHRLGHFIGLEDHEKGDVSSVNTDPAVRDMVFSIEPGVYLQGRFGVRIEDLVIVTEEGCEILNHVDKELCILGV